MATNVKQHSLVYDIKNGFMLRLKLFFICLMFISCHKHIDPSIPECIQEIIADPELSKDLQTVRVQENDGEFNYWMNTDHMHFDGTEYILNASCDTVCFICGECFPPSCYNDYTDQWEIIWEK